MATSTGAHREMLLDLGMNVAAPTIVLTFLSGGAMLGPVGGIVTALAFPIVHSVVTVIRSRTISPLAALALVSVLLTGGIGLLEISVRWFAWKEAAFPAVLGVAAAASVHTRWPAIPVLLRPLLDQEKVSALLAERGEAPGWVADQRRATRQLGAVMLATAAGTFAFARFMVTSPTGSEAFAAELGRYTGLSLPVLGVPSTVLAALVLRSLLLSMERRTGVDVEDLLK